MIESLGRRLRVVFGRSAAPVEPIANRPDSTARLTQRVEFVAYGEDCILSGLVRLGADRLTDMLNEPERSS